MIPASENAHIGTPVEISLPDATIARAVVSSPDLPPSGFAIDDIEFEPGAPPPAPPRVEVPDLTGLTPPAARDDLEAIGFRLGSVRVVVNDQFTDGTIFSQVPHFHTVAPRGLAVDVEVASAQVRRDTVPNLRDLDIQAARARLAQAHMQLGVVRGVNQATLARAIVAGQSVPPGSLQPWGTSVDVDMAPSIAATPLETVPDLARLTLDSARARLNRAGFQLGQVRPVGLADQVFAMVVRQSPPAGSLGRPGTRVDIDMVRVPPPTPPQPPWRLPLEIVVPAALAAVIGLRVWRGSRWRIRTRVQYGMSTVRAHLGPGQALDPDFQVRGRLDPGTHRAREGK